MEAMLADANENGAVHFGRWAADCESTRRNVARFIGANPQEVAFVKNTSEALSTVALGISWTPGDRVVVPESEFPANLYPWVTMRERGVRVELLPESALTDLDALAAACRGARLLAISFVQYLSGHRIDAAAIGEICRQTGTIFVLDAIQGLGAFPVDVKRCGVGVLAADGHKWLTGPEGAGILFVDEALIDELKPREVGWMSVADYNDYTVAAGLARGAGELPWREGAGRYECGSYNTVGILGLGAAVGLLESAGADAIAAHVIALNQHLCAGLAEKGCRLRRLTAAPAHASGIVSFQHPRTPAAALVAGLAKQGIVAACRGDWVRLSPHAYNTIDEAAAVLEAIAAM